MMGRHLSDKKGNAWSKYSFAVENFVGGPFCGFFLAAHATHAPPGAGVIRDP
jgi:hypothetical protein